MTAKGPEGIDRREFAVRGPGALLDSVQSMANPFLDRTQVPLKLEMTDSFAYPGDETKMCRILLNLIRNAAEALHRHRADQPLVTMSAEASDGGFRFIVTDNGPGLADEIRDQLSVPFATHRKSGGTGLGLAIVKQFVDAHGGEVCVQTGSEGTTFSIRLPNQ